MTIGFMNGWGKNMIQIGASKVKKAKNFFDDTQSDQK
jgi:hypothetical protein